VIPHKSTNLLNSLVKKGELMFCMFFDLIAEFAFLFVQSYIDAKLFFVLSVA